MDHNAMKLMAFTKYLSEKDMELLSRISPLAITDEGGFFSEAEEGNHYSTEDWENVCNYLDDFLTNVYEF